MIRLIEKLHSISDTYGDLWSRYSLAIVAFDMLYRDPLFIKHIEVDEYSTEVFCTDLYLILSHMHA